ncbi:MAG TPA: protein kinase [Holophagaceae bacterium]|nr:protein kinase [Holophagaceae bacterium]
MRRIGSGGMGEVYLAEDTRLARQVAIKLLPQGEGLDVSAKKRLLREAQAAAKLDHPNLCAIHEVGESESGSYIVMQFVEGQTLSEWLKANRPTLERILDVGMQVADALAEAHRHGLVHRDIKPANLMITPRGQVKVLDFGLAKDVNGPIGGYDESKTHLTTPGMVVGTVPYMSPEQVKGDTLDGRSDLFSLGSVLFEMATGHRPFQAKSGVELMSAILVHEPPLLDEESNEIHPELRRILRRALAKELDQRYPTAQDLVSDLRNLRDSLSKGSLAAVAPALASHQQRFPSKSQASVSTRPISGGTLQSTRRTRIWAGVGIALMLGGVAVAGALWTRDRNTVDSIAVLPFVNAGGDPDMEYLSDGLTESLINQLSHLPKLRVIARSSILRYKGKEPDLKAIARELGVRAVVVGRIQSRKDQLTISVELADAEENRHLWGEQVTRPTSELLTLQDSLAEEISQNLGRQISPDDQKALASAKVQTDPEAYQLYLKGRYFADQWTPDKVKQAMVYFDQALARDPRFALAHVGKAYAYWGLSSQFLAPSEAMPKVKAEAEAALAIDPNLAEAHTAHAAVLALYEHDYPRAEAEFRRAIELNPGSESTHIYFGYMLIGRGRADEALDQFNQAKRLDPMSFLLETYTGMAYFIAKRDNLEALKHFSRASELQPDFWWPQLFKGMILDLQGRQDEATASFKQARENGGSTYVLAVLGARAARNGNRKEALELLEQIQAIARDGKVYASPRDEAIIYLALGNREKAMELLWKAFDSRDEDIAFLSTDPSWDSLRDDSGFKTLLGRSQQP